MSAKLRIYACGGAGTNVAKQFESEKKTPGKAEIVVSYIDTSRANLRGVDADKIYLVKDVNSDADTDGSGRVRSKNVGIIKPQIKSIMYAHPAEYMNVVLYSGEGGTGNTAGILVHKHLLEKGERVVSIVIGGESDGQAISNVVGTLGDLDKIAELVERPVVAVYDHNEPGEPFKTVDDFVIQNILSLATLTSRENDALDSADLTNFFDYSEVSQHEPMLCRLNIVTGIEHIPEETIAVASLFKNIESARTLPQKYGYSTTGYCQNDVLGGNRPDELHFCLTMGMNEVFSRLSKVNEDLKAREAARVKVKRIANLGGESSIL